MAVEVVEVQSVAVQEDLVEEEVDMQLVHQVQQLVVKVMLVDLVLHMPDQEHQPLVVVEQVVLGNQVLEMRLVEMGVLEFKFPQHSKTQYLNQSQIVVV
jgi:hypothetical protein